jgi:Fic family protein
MAAPWPFLSARRIDLVRYGAIHPVQPVTLAPHFTITNLITAALTTIERARGFLEAASLSEEWVRRTSQRALLLEAHHTTDIEGTQLSIEQAEQVWAGQDVAGADPDDVRELLNYRQAFELVSEYLSSGSPISEGLIREIHKRLVAGVRGGEAKPGEYVMFRTTSPTTRRTRSSTRRHRQRTCRR